MKKEKPNLATSNLNLPQSVTILAPGSNGIDHWEEIEGYVIAVNAAVKAAVHIDAWLVADGNAIRTDWFQSACKNFDGLKLFSNSLNNAADDIADYIFHTNGNLTDSYIQNPDGTIEWLPIKLFSDKFRATESVTGVAIDAAVRSGVKHITLCGVDLEGGYFFDKRDAKKPYTDIPCIFREGLSLLIDYFEVQGITFRTLSRTRIRRWDYQHDWIGTGRKCRNCGREFQYDPETGEGENYYYIIGSDGEALCPYCNNK